MPETQVPFFLKVAPKNFNWPVKVPVPAEGHYVFAEFTGVFRYIQSADVDAWLAPEGKPRTDKELAADVLLEVRDIRDENGEVIPTSPELVARMLAVDRAPSAVVATFLAVIRGIAAEKN